MALHLRIRDRPSKCVRTELSILLYVQQQIRTVFRRVRRTAKSTVSVVMSVCRSIRKERLGAHWTDFSEILYLNNFRKCLEKIRT
jgi:hypothetical protein